LQFDATPGRARHLTKQTAERFVDDYINEEQGQGRRLRRDILKGEEPADLPLQAPNRYELAINLPAVLTRADEVIE
jgi:hypothetical protein